MISERRLFERLVDPDPPGSRRRGLDIRRLTGSVVCHLRCLMNSRHGCTPIRADYGIPDLNEFVFALPDSLGAMRQAIQKAIEQYEPRLRAVRVKYIADPDRPLDVRFEISARLVTEGEEVPISFSTRTGGLSGLEIME
jgi:type VI secretion system protein